MQDKSKKIKKIIIILLIICLLLLVVIKIISKRNKLDEIEVIDGAYNFELNKVQKVQSRSDYCLVKDSIENFYNYYLSNRDVYSLLDNDYIEDFDIKKDDIEGKFGDFKDVTIDITKMYVSDIGLGIKAYFVYGNIIDVKANKVTKLSIGIKIDSRNRTFSILPYEYLEQNDYLNINEKSTTKFKEQTEVKNKMNNTFEYAYVNDKTYIDYLFKNYINRCIYNIDLIYEYLDEEYKQKRFGNLQNFEEYININQERYNSYDLKNLKQYGDFENMEEYMLYMAQNHNLKIETYQKTKETNYTQYICIDNLNNYYIFKETAPMEYTIILDTYTIDLPEFTEKYETATTEERVMLNIQKIVEAINAKDYKYVYGKLADEFKANYFKTYEEFEKYAKNEFDIGNEVIFNRYTESENYSTYGITLKGKNKTITKTIVMRLDVGTNFVMSFNVN